MEKMSAQPLLAERDVQSDFEPEASLGRPKWRRGWALEASIVLNVVLLALACAGWLSSFRSRPTLAREGDVYCEFLRSRHAASDSLAPAQDAIEYTTKVFRSGLPGEKTEYQGSSEEALQNWSALYDSECFDIR